MAHGFRVKNTAGQIVLDHAFRPFAAIGTIDTSQAGAKGARTFDPGPGRTLIATVHPNVWGTPNGDNYDLGYGTSDDRTYGTNVTVSGNTVTWDITGSLRLDSTIVVWSEGKGLPGADGYGMEIVNSRGEVFLQRGERSMCFIKKVTHISRNGFTTQRFTVPEARSGDTYIALNERDGPRATVTGVKAYNGYVDVCMCRDYYDSNNERSTDLYLFGPHPQDTKFLPDYGIVLRNRNNEIVWSNAYPRLEASGYTHYGDTDPTQFYDIDGALICGDLHAFRAKKSRKQKANWTWKSERFKWFGLMEWTYSSGGWMNPQGWMVQANYLDILKEKEDDHGLSKPDTYDHKFIFNGSSGTKLLFADKSRYDRFA